MKLIMVDHNKNYILKAGWISKDDDNKESLHTGTIYIEKGRIAALVPKQVTSDDYRLKHRSRQSKVLDLSHLTIIPPLVDCHVHLALDGLDFTAARKRWDQPKELEMQVNRQLRDTLHHGILAVRDGGDRRGVAWQYRNKINSGQITGPRIIASIQGLRKPQTYGSFLGPDTPMSDLGSTLDRLVQQQIDQIKVIVSGVVSFKEYGKVGPVQYTAVELTTIVQEAKHRGLRVMTHASSDLAVKMAIEAGVDTIEHGYFLSTDALELMAEKAIPWIPTVIPVAAQLQNRGSIGPDRESRYVIEKTVDRQLAMINKAAALGVTLGLGTDAGAAGVRHGYGYQQELELYQQAGLTPTQIYQSATANSARILGLPWGQIAPGYPAALIAVQGNPLADLSALSRLKYAFLPW